MHILRNPGIKRIVLMMHLMDLVKKAVMEEPVEEVKYHILEIVDEHDLEAEFRESGKVLEAQLDALQVDHVH
jgi:hypothetical protein